MSKNFFDKVVGFFGKHGPELETLGNVLVRITSGMAINTADKREIREAAQGLVTSGQNIQNSMESLRKAAKEVADLKGLKLDKQAIVAAVAQALPDVMEEALKLYFEKHPIKLPNETNTGA